jgi:hypothetical protein
MKHRNRAQLTIQQVKMLKVKMHVVGFDCANAVKNKEAVRENVVSTPKGRTSQSLNKQSISIHNHTLWIFGEDFCKVSVIGEGTVVRH